MKKPKGIVVKEAEKAIDDFLSGKPIQSKKIQRIAETRPEIPKTWILPEIIYEKICRYYVFKEINFPELEQSEIGFIPLIGEKNPTYVKDIILFHQLVTPASVSYSDKSADEVKSRIKAMNQSLEEKLFPGGIIHFHPDGIPGPSSIDTPQFEKLTWQNKNYQNIFGWVDATHEFSKAKNKRKIRSALDTKDAVIIGAEEQAKVYTKVEYGYNLFLIFSRGQEPWIGVGECRKYLFNIKPDSYRLLRSRNGIRLSIVKDDLEVSLDQELMKQQIAEYIKPLTIPKPKRAAVIPVSITHMPEIYHNPDIVQKLEDRMPTTTGEFFSLLNDFLRISEDNPEAKAIRLVYDLFADIYKSKKPFPEQLAAATQLLCNLSLAYKKAIDLKNGK